MTGLAALTLTACSADDDTRVATTPRPAVATPLPSAAPAPTATSPSNYTLRGASTDTASQAATNEAVALLTAVRAARQDGYDRLVFEFRNAVPGYRARYVERPLTQDGSGAEVDVDGAAVLEVRLERAAGVDLSEPSAPATYRGPSRFAPPTTQLVEVARIGDFEGTLTWAAGLRTRTPFKVSTLTSPPRLVIDLQQ